VDEINKLAEETQLRPEHVNRLLAPLDDPQAPARRLIEIIWDDYAKRGRWPIFQYAEALLYRELGHPDATATLLDCPGVPFQHGMAYYGWFWVTDNRLSSPQPGDTIGLTVVGMSRLREVTRRHQAEVEVANFLSALSGLVALERNFVPSPTEVHTVEVSGEQLGWFPASEGIGSGENYTFRIGQMLSQEPSTRSYIFRPTPDTWAATLNSGVRRYDGVQGLDDYLERLMRQIAPPVSEPAPILESALAVPEAFDYLNVVWRERAGRALFGFRRLEAAAKIAFDCNSSDELESRLSALCDLLYHLKLPGSDGEVKLGDLQGYLDSRLPDEGAERAHRAVDDLRAITQLRAWKQHSGGNAERAARRAMRTIGLQLPTSDWGGAWRKVQAVCVAALNAIREEVERAAELTALDAPGTNSNV
jgi:hypothetical protein